MLRHVGRRQVLIWTVITIIFVIVMMSLYVTAFGENKVIAYADQTWNQVETFTRAGVYANHEYGIFYDPKDGLWDIVVL